ncbi:MAG: hypothetical protein M1827_002227 [Pycnora praestabilis]|nr:MAG: hypothetical protein M1827_002227 [Pycnora praestabilis]
MFTCLYPFNPPFAARKDWSDFKAQSFAIGFDLTAGYGTAAVAFINGTIVDVARADGTSEYNNVLARLSLKSSTHPTPPYYDCNAQTADLGRQWHRYFRKRLGFPASTDVAALADVLSKLKVQTDSFLGRLGPLELAFITVPNLPALYLEDLVDAAEHVKVQLLTLPDYIHRSGDQAQWPVSELNTAFAGNGFGRDGLYSGNIEAHLYYDDDNSNYSDSSVPKTPWSENVLSVLFTNTALTAYVLPLSSAAHFYAADGIANFSLGLSSYYSLPHVNSIGSVNASYWFQIRLALRTALDSYLNRGHELGRVISYGESAHNEIFDSILREEVLAAQFRDEPEQQPHFSSNDPVFAAARGAAEFARFCPRLPSYGSCFPDLRPRAKGW